MVRRAEGTESSWKTADLGGVELAYKLAGTGERIVVLAGGTGMPPITWEVSGLAPELVSNGYRVLTFAARGVAPSSAPPPPYSVADLALDLQRLLEHVGIGTCDLVGYSLGGLVAELFARTRPDMVRSLVLMASAGPLNPVLRAELEMEAALVERTGALPEAVTRFTELMVLLAPDVLRDDHDQVEQWLSLLSARAGAWTSADGEVGQSVAAFTWLHDPGRMPRLADINAPTLIASFEHDPTFPPAGGRAASKILPRGTFIEIPDAAHGGLMTHPDACTRAILDFLSTT